MFECFGATWRYGPPCLGFDELWHPAPTARAAHAIGMRDFDCELGCSCVFDDSDLRKNEKFRQVGLVLL